MKLVSSIAAVLALVSTAEISSAQQFGSKGDFAIEVERLFAIHGTKVTLEQTGGDAEDSYTGISFGWRGPAGQSQSATSPFDVPRLALDYFVIDSVSIGGSLGYASINEDDDSQEGFGQESYSTLLLHLRGGYAYMFNEIVGIWPQAGLTYHTLSQPDAFSEDGLALSVNLPFVVSPVNHFAALVGLYADVDLLGERDYEGGNPPPNADRRYRSMGLQIGMMGWL